MDTQSAFRLWREKATLDQDLLDELTEISGDADAIDDRFYRELAFGTGGLRGIIGAGTNRMNIYTVGKASQGLAAYVKQAGKTGQVAIAYDSRIKSDLFAKTAACVFAANGIRVHLYRELMPTPMLSFAVRYLACDAGVVITASHNPSVYNGYKAYGPDGCQLTSSACEAVTRCIEKVDPFEDVKRVDFEQAIQSGQISYISDDVIEAYLDCVQAQALSAHLCKTSGLRVVYTPLHGSGNKPVRSILSRIGIEQVTIVPEQELPDGNFPTAPFPNPEIRQAFAQALKLAEKVQPDLLLATDPDCDRVGIAVKQGGDYVLMSGNEVGALLLHYILDRRCANGTLPERPLAVKTIVTTRQCEAIAKKFNCELIEVLTGFKYIGEQITLLEQKGEQDRYVFGFEESYGYLAGHYVRDKDAVVASMLICDMACFYKAQGKTLLDVLAELNDTFGYYHNQQISFTFEGQQGVRAMQTIMETWRAAPPAEFSGCRVKIIRDYALSRQTQLDTGAVSPISLPHSDVLSYTLENDASIIIRPSGTEPKIKIYLSIKAENQTAAAEQADRLTQDVKQKMGLS